VPATIPSYDLTTNWWENRSGWCRIAAFADNLFSLKPQLPGI
jgi:hypothetical protein